MNQRARVPSRLNTRAKLGYGVGDAGLNFYWQGAGYFLLYFYTDVAGLPNTTAGIVYAAGGFVDAVTDPAMGIISDRTKTRWGRYRPYLFFGAIPLGISFILLFTAPQLAGPQTILVVALLTHILFRLCYTAVSIPYSALGARMTFDASERTRLSGIRMLCGALGGVAIVTVAATLRKNMTDAQAFTLTSIAAALLGSMLIVITFAATAERPAAPGESTDAQSRYKITRIAAMLAANTPFLVLNIAIFLLTIANMIVVKTILYRFDHLLSAPFLGGVAVTVVTGAHLVAIPFWVWVYLRYDKKPAFLCGCGVVIAGLSALYIVGDRSITLSIATYAFIAVGFSAFAVGFWSILPDTIDFGHWRSGNRIESGLVGLASAIQKTAIALAGLGVGVVLDLIGYRANFQQNADTLTALHHLSTITPAVLMILSALVFANYPLTTSYHARIVRKLESQGKEPVHDR